MSDPSDMHLYMYAYVYIHVQSAAQPNYMQTKYSLDKTKPLPYTRTLNSGNTAQLWDGRGRGKQQ